MTKQALWPKVKAAAAILSYSILSVGALAFADYALAWSGPVGLRRLYALSRLPERSLQALVGCCHGDERPDCPILDDLAGDAAPADRP